MQTFTTAKALTAHRKTLTRPVAFVPTMGALHAGHAELIDVAAATGAYVIASIFVNPTQFNEMVDLDNYPRTPEADLQLLDQHGCDAVYLPPEYDVYPDEYSDPTVGLNFGPLVQVMEGANRPGHFAGVAQVVYRLLDIVRPDVLIMGQKDYQQVAVVRQMLRQMDVELDVLVVPTVREPSGLALSSRNRRMNDEQAAAAATINRHLQAVAAGVRAGWPPRNLELTAMHLMGKHALLQPEYVSVFNGATLQPWSPGEEADEIVVAAAVHCGPVRLIDNVIAHRAS